MTKQIRQVKSGDRQIRAFGNSLAEILGSGDFPPGVTGDLSDLLDTLRRGESLLIGLMELRAGFKQAPAAKLLELEILIGDDLRMIARDLLPVLKKVRKAAFLRHKGKLGTNEPSQKLPKKERSPRQATKRPPQATAPSAKDGRPRPESE